MRNIERRGAGAYITAVKPHITTIWKGAGRQLSEIGQCFREDGADIRGGSAVRLGNSTGVTRKLLAKLAEERPGRRTDTTAQHVRFKVFTPEFWPSTQTRRGQRIFAQHFHYSTDHSTVSESVFKVSHRLMNTLHSSTSQTREALDEVQFSGVESVSGTVGDAGTMASA
ncbi:hypothetical protein EDB89DRAFT_1902423 [Lactarius sanguifluus]|nr:hypothetical protein EDB89DRAFT_1902423 [Lactarius sanguifluus]